MKRLLIIIAFIEIIIFSLLSLYFHNSDKSNIILAYKNERSYLTSVQSIKKEYVSNKQDILNNIYYALNNKEDARFVCNKDYDCSKDIINILNDSLLMREINNIVDPFNSYNSFKLQYNNGFIIKFDKLYNKDDILILNKAIDLIIKDLINDKMTDVERLVVLHNYLINNIKYQNGSGNKATTALISGETVCSGYADLLAIFLNKLNIPNYKVVNDNHVWNVVLINNEWKHIDLTYDDPIKESSVISYNYFLINTDTLHNYHDNNHYFDKNIYIEL